MSRGAFAIRAEDLGKRYRVGRAAGSYRTLRETVVDAALSPARRARDVLRGKAASGESETLWALRHASFEVAVGEVMGVIGRNGSGKSTLLKILSRITEPTEGQALVRGRVGSLLEVGTGFHPELTGRENIQLNGSILGMTKGEVAAKFDEIVAFAEIDRFLDTPVKRYSSGMYVRLAFAVAAHLEPEVLLVDEVLAVGDAAFQRKCIQRMQMVAREGRTVLFVSHNMNAIRNLCSRTAWLHGGQIRSVGDTHTVVDGYLRSALRGDTLEDVPVLLAALPEDPAVRLTDIRFIQEGLPTSHVVNGSPVELHVGYVVKRPEPGLRIYFDVLDEDHDVLVRSFSDEHSPVPGRPEPGAYLAVATLPSELLADRTYHVRVNATVYNVRYCAGDGVILPLHVEHSTGVNRAYPNEASRAKLRPHISWETQSIDRPPDASAAWVG